MGRKRDICITFNNKDKFTNKLITLNQEDGKQKGKPNTVSLVTLLFSDKINQLYQHQESISPSFWHYPHTCSSAASNHSAFSILVAQ